MEIDARAVSVTCNNANLNTNKQTTEANTALEANSNKQGRTHTTPNTSKQTISAFKFKTERSQECMMIRKQQIVNVIRR